MCRARVIYLVDEHDAPREKPEVLDLEFSASSIDGATPEVYSTSPTDDVFAFVPQISSPAVHAKRTVPPREMKKWNLLPLPKVNWYMLENFEPGFQICVYDALMTSFFEVPSEHVFPTHGAIRYIEHYNEFGPYSRFRFQLCSNFQQGRCQKGSSCTYIHAYLNQDIAQKIHLNNGTMYETLPAGIVFNIHPPNANGTLGRSETIPTEFILRTKGATELYHSVTNNCLSAFHRPQHCAHFQYKKMCNRGTECSFIHSMLPPCSQ